MARHGPARMQFPTRSKFAPSYGTLFRGKTPIDTGRLEQISSLPSYMPLYDALAKNKKGAEAIEGAPFIWNCNNIDYTSNNCTFDRNMWIANYIGGLWNTTAGGEARAEEQNTNVLVPIVQSINFLLDRGGLEEDLSRPPPHLEKLLPEVLQRKSLAALRNASLALAWKNIADGVKNPEDEPSHHQMRARMLMRSAELGSAASPYLKNGFSKSRQLEAGAALAEKWRSQSEYTPEKEYSVKAHQFYAAVGADLGMYVMHSARVAKADMERGSATCLGDLSTIYAVNDDVIKHYKKNKVPLANLFRDEAQSAVNSEPPADPTWMNTANPCCYKGSPLGLY